MMNMKIMIVFGIFLLLFSVAFAGKAFYGTGEWVRQEECSMIPLVVSIRELSLTMSILIFTVGVILSLILLYLDKKNCKTIRGFKIKEYKVIAKGVLLFGVIVFLVYLTMPFLLEYIMNYPYYEKYENCKEFWFQK